MQTLLKPACVFLLGLVSAAVAQQAQFDSDSFGGYQARSIGPAAMGGRIADVDAVMDKRLTIYAGAAGGGLWKSSDAGITFKPVFDKTAAAQFPALNSAMENQKLEPIKVLTREEWEKKQKH